MNRYFATSPRGLEHLLADELTAVGATSVHVVAGGVQFAGDWSVCYRANLESRLATRILWFLAKGSYTKEDDIYRLAMVQRWPDLFDLSRTIRVLTAATKSPLRSIDFVTLRVKDAICDRFRALQGDRPSVDTHEPDVRVHVYLTEHDCSLYLDTSGAPLWQRGLRHATVEAPLKENLAAGILRLSGWQPGTALVDPMCGSGTFLLEAVQMALERAPGLGRSFAFEKLAGFDALAWSRLKSAAEARCKAPAALPMWASDRDEKAVRATKRNLQEAGLGGVVKVVAADVLELEAPAAAGVMVANPPYGERIGEQEELAALYPELGSALKKRWSGWNCYFFTADTRLPKLLGLKPSRKTPLFNGALDCRLYEIKMVAGSNRKPKADGETTAGA